jgi:hypothetical protein
MEKNKGLCYGIPVGEEVQGILVASTLLDSSVKKPLLAVFK